MTQVRVIDKTEENITILPLGTKAPSKTPDVELTMVPDCEIVQGFVGRVLFRQKDDVLEHTIWVRTTGHFACRVKERYRLWIGGQRKEDAEA